MKRIMLSIDGMTCSACSNGLEKYLNKQKGILEATVNLVMSSASIKYDEKIIKLEDLDRFVKEAGFKSLGKYKLNADEKKNKRETIRVILVSLFSIICITLSLLSMNHKGFMKLIDNYALAFTMVICFLSTVVILLSIGIIKNGIKNALHKTPNMDTLVTIGVLTSYFYSIYRIILNLFGNGSGIIYHGLYFESATMIMFFVNVGKFIEKININKTKSAIQNLVTITPKNATIIANDDEKEVTIDEVKKGDILICRPGGRVAVDGEIIEGETHIDESFITGESIPVKKTTGMKVVAGGINYDGTIKYKAERIGKDSTVSEIVKMVSEASNSKIPIGKLADKICGIFVPIVIAISILTFICWLIISKDIEISINYLVSVLVVACPCSLGLATPLAIVVASGIASQIGILIKKSEVIETAYKVKTIFLDKTGTLTKGKLRVSKYYNYSDIEDSELLKYIASIEKKSEHPIAKAIVEYAKENKAMMVACKSFKVIQGYGVYAQINNDEFYIGNKKIVDEYAKDSKENAIKDASVLSENGNSLIFVVRNGEVVSLLGVRDSIREESKELIAKLNENKINNVMLTRR